MDIINRTEVMNRIGVASPTLYRMERDGLPVIRTGKVVRYDWDEVVAWLKVQNKESV